MGIPLILFAVFLLFGGIVTTEVFFLLLLIAILFD